MDFSFYAAYVFGGDLIPLYTYEDLKPEDVKELERIFERNNIDKTVPKVHPVL